ncbi:MAG: Rpn family recombination-promoting nuclease/putative transposase [Magnetococcales bacterium]|nr:Rpn family recombination-promoting nuclease/putative transposase [Magnetococcales bacterium]
MIFIDPRIDFAFKKIFGSEEAKDVLISFLESLLGLDGERRLAEVTLLDPFQAPRIREMKYSILDVKCRDHRGITYIVEMQIQKVAAFLKRIQYNAAKAYVQQIEKGEEYPKLNQVIAITITDFNLFPGFPHCISRHESRETLTGQSYLQDIRHDFIELPKFTKSLGELDNVLDQWLFFLKSAESLTEIPAQFNAPPLRHAFEIARLANMNPDERELYDKAGMAVTDAKGAVELARDEGIAIGEARGEARGLRKGEVTLLLKLMQHRFGPLSEEVVRRVENAEARSLDIWSEALLDTPSLEALLER